MLSCWGAEDSCLALFSPHGPLCSKIRRMWWFETSYLAHTFKVLAIPHSIHCSCDSSAGSRLVIGSRQITHFTQLTSSLKLRERQNTVDFIFKSTGEVTFRFLAVPYSTVTAPQSVNRAWQGMYKLCSQITEAIMTSLLHLTLLSLSHTVKK